MRPGSSPGFGGSFQKPRRRTTRGPPVDRLRHGETRRPGREGGGLILDKLRLEGLVVKLAKRVRMDRDLLDSLYFFVKAKYRETWWLSEEFYLGREVLALLLWGSPGEFPHLPARMRREVGPTTPDAGSPGDIRYDFQGVNRLMNPIHASEDPASSLREAMVFFDLKEILDAILSEGDVGANPEVGGGGQKPRR
ncbi:MAG: hypothetical protein DRO06_01005 [Thermoproteota archaeon]|nr:MAG: hypothetical protein DRO06_01005 [Candidatus Korarchaeota archaeon]